MNYIIFLQNLKNFLLMNKFFKKSIILLKDFILNLIVKFSHLRYKINYQLFNFFLLSLLLLFYSRYFNKIQFDHLFNNYLIDAMAKMYF
jgi:hypothetical protein